jgi:hypothetical protein
MIDPFNNLPLAAFIAAGVTMCGWGYTHWRERAMERARRAEKTRDYQKAIFSEISAYVEVLENDDLYAYKNEIIAKMQKGTAAKPFIPFIPNEENNAIFKALVRDIHILPRAVIDPVVLYYSQLVAIQALIADLRGQTYASLDKDRRIAIYVDYIAMKNEALTLGREALRTIKELDDA